MMRIRFNADRRVTGWHNVYTKASHEQMVEFMLANKNRHIVVTESSKSAAEAFKASMKGL